MSMVTLDSAWRQYRGATRDQANSVARALGARNVWAQTLLEQMMERLEEARDDLNLDVTQPKVLWALGVPCTKCLAIITRKTNHGHELFIGGKDSPAVYAECRSHDGAIDPTKTVMPTWPDMPKAEVQ